MSVEAVEQLAQGISKFSILGDIPISTELGLTKLARSESARAQGWSR